MLFWIAKLFFNITIILAKTNNDVFSCIKNNALENEYLDSNLQKD